MLACYRIVLWKNYCYQSKKDFVPLPEFLRSSSLQLSAFLQHTDLQDNIFAVLWAELLCLSYLHSFSFPISDRLLFFYFIFLFYLFPTVFYLTMEEKVHTLCTQWISFSKLGSVPSFQLFHDLGALRLCNKMKINL